MSTNQFLGFPYISLYRLVPQSVTLRNSDTFSVKSLQVYHSMGEKP